ncbi:hypothetical protein [Sporosarcina sp. D27]|uniref:hypothetical protein n=1 Tax=Sporosarcina sp. D27 TaxID=1382305 RepID=UPI0004B80184|nr:hypothetical protein [Sporosarcina sp. D27]
MNTFEIKKSVAKEVCRHTILAAYSTVGFNGSPPDLASVLREDLEELQKLEHSPIVDAAIRLVEIAIIHAAKPTTKSHTEARVARDELGDFLISAKEVKG